MDLFDLRCWCPQLQFEKQAASIRSGCPAQVKQLAAKRSDRHATATPSFG